MNLFKGLGKQITNGIIRMEMRGTLLIYELILAKMIGLEKHMYKFDVDEYLVFVLGGIE